MSTAGVCHSSLDGPDGADRRRPCRLPGCGARAPRGRWLRRRGRSGGRRIGACGGGRAATRDRVARRPAARTSTGSRWRSGSQATASPPRSSSSRAATFPRSDAGWPRIPLGASSRRASSPERRSPQSPADVHAAAHGSHCCSLGIAAGLAAEWASYDRGELGLTIADLTVGWILIGCGCVAWERRPESRVGAIMSFAGFTWFLGTAFEPALYPPPRPARPAASLLPDRAPADPPRPRRRGRSHTSTRAIEPLARNDIAYARAERCGRRRIAVRVSPARRVPHAGPLASRSGLLLAFAAVLAVGAVGRLDRLESRPVLWVYSS